MKCKTCDDLLSDYKQAVTHFTTALLDGGTLLHPAKETEDLARKCNDANDALMEHWRKEHADLSHKTASA